MAVETVGNLPPQAEELRAKIEKQLPDIISSFSQVLQEQFGFRDVRVGGFTLVPEESAASGISCDEEGCSISEDS